MDYFIHRPTKEQIQFFDQAGSALGIPAFSMEKDFWVCWTLSKIFSMPDWKTNLTFKGGTSLSKAWGLINRFSEDIDIVVDREFLGISKPEMEGISRKRRDRYIKNIKEKCKDCIHTALLPALDHTFRKALPITAEWSLRLASPIDDPDEQTILFQYPGGLSGPSTYISNIVKIELGARGDTWPAEKSLIRPYIAEAFEKILKIKEFPVQTLSPERTFWEKVMLLHEEGFRPSHRMRKARYARHYYDLWCLIRKGVAERALANDELFQLVVNHRSFFFEVSWVDYSTCEKGKLCIMPKPEQYESWRADYDEMRKTMIFGSDVPTFEEILGSVLEFEQKVNNGLGSQAPK